MFTHFSVHCTLYSRWFHSSRLAARARGYPFVRRDGPHARRGQRRQGVCGRPAPRRVQRAFVGALALRTCPRVPPRLRPPAPSPGSTPGTQASPRRRHHHPPTPVLRPRVARGFRGRVAWPLMWLCPSFCDAHLSPSLPPFLPLLQSEIRREFDRYGHVTDTWVARRPPGFAFVWFADPRDADVSRMLRGAATT